jgi:hypothetical protein
MLNPACNTKHSQRNTKHNRLRRQKDVKPTIRPGKPIVIEDCKRQRNYPHGATKEEQPEHPEIGATTLLVVLYPGLIPGIRKVNIQNNLQDQIEHTGHSREISITIEEYIINKAGENPKGHNYRELEKPTPGIYHVGKLPCR